jgi:4a-hydroxytetrahydrobiopterin dehydratase
MFAEKKCVPCEGGISPMKPKDIDQALAHTPGWEVAFHGKAVAIKRRFTFKNFADALAFTNKVGALVEKEGHHPDISFGWGYAEFLLYTHAIGGLHENDFIIAAKINKLHG